MKDFLIGEIDWDTFNTASLRNDYIYASNTKYGRRKHAGQD